jgi:hypothetical protein
MGQSIMEISTTNAERPAPMSDVALAKNLVAEIAGDCWDGKGDMLDRVYRAIDKYFREQKQPHSWTPRRVRAFWHREAAGVRYHEMIELATVAAAVKIERDQRKEARKSHAEFIARTARLATALAVSDQEFHRDAIEAFSRVQGGRIDRAIGHVARQGDGNPASGNSSSGALGAGDRG